MTRHTLETYDPPAAPIPILYADAALILVEKPAGLLTVPGKDPHLADCLESRIKAQFTDALLVHRLDMATSGIIVFARTAKAQKHLGLQFEKRRVKKRYQALVAGTLTDPEGLIDLPLVCDWPNRPRQKVCFETGKPAQTRYAVIEPGSVYSRVDLYPVTGRSHQLRVHMASIGHAILGDPLYGADHEDALTVQPRMTLHAAELHLRHPGSGDDLVFKSPVPF